MFPRSMDDVSDCRHYMREITLFDDLDACEYTIRGEPFVSGGQATPDTAYGGLAAP